MDQRRAWSGIAFAGLILLSSCTPPKLEAPQVVKIDKQTHLYSVHAVGVSRGELLDQLKRLSHIEVRPQPPRDEKLTLNVDNVDVDTLLSRILPSGMHYIARRGNQETPAIASSVRKRKVGPKLAIRSDLPSKKAAARPLKRTGNLKPSAKKVETPTQLVRKPGKMTKAPAEKLVAVEHKYPKKALAKRIPRKSMRVTIAFEEGKAPRVVAVQTIEGGTPEHLVQGPYLFVLMGSNGKPVQYGSFQDPLVIHSYTQEGRHSVSRAKSGIAGITLMQDKIESTSLLIIDARKMTLPRKLDDKFVSKLSREGKTLMKLPAANLVRALDKENVMFHPMKEENVK